MMPRPLRTVLACLLALACLAPAPASADEPRPPSLKPEALDLLPFDAFQRQDFNKEHGGLVFRMNLLRKQLSKLYQQRTALRTKKGKRSAQEAEKLAALQKEIRRTAPQISALMARITEEVRDHGVDGMLIAYMNRAPTGARRVQRYSQGLVLLVEDLTPQQRWMFDRTLTQMEGAYNAIAAQKERTLLALKQSELDRDEQRAVAGTFDRQIRVMELRFWMLVDATLERHQKVWIWERLPQAVRRKSQPVEHLYTLPGITASQGSRLRALNTEIEHEASPDNAAVRRITAELKARDRKLSGPQRKALNQERGVAYGRLNELNRFRRDEVRKILTEEQWLEYLAIPPGLSTNDRSGSYRRVLEGWKPTWQQQQKIEALRKTQRDAARKARARMNLARRDGADYGPDSPQMMSMQMAMSEAKGSQAQAARDLIGGIFREVMTVDEVGRWVIGHWGYKR